LGMGSENKSINSGIEKNKEVIIIEL